jgi:alpha-beta hydrolase superfamily lysophospholipase
MTAQHIKHEAFKSSDNKKLNIHHFQIDGEPEKVVLIVHGHGEHAMRYQQQAERFAKHNIAVSALTLRGHGLSDGKKGHAPSLSQLILDVEYFIRQVRLKYMEADFYFYGHSMGGNIVLNYLLRDQSSELKAGIVTSPWIKLAFQPPKWKTTLGNVVAEIIPSFTEKSDLDDNEISTIPEEVKAYKDDELIHSYISAKLFKEIQQGGQNILNQYDKFKHPIFLAHGELDKITSHQASKELSELTDLAEWHTYSNSKHEIHHDKDAEKLFNNVLSFVQGH